MSTQHQKRRRRRIKKTGPQNAEPPLPWGSQERRELAHAVPEADFLLGLQLHRCIFRACQFHSSSNLSQIFSFSQNEILNKPNYFWNTQQSMNPRRPVRIHHCWNCGNVHVLCDATKGTQFFHLWRSRFVFVLFVFGVHNAAVVVVSLEVHFWAKIRHMHAADKNLKTILPSMENKTFHIHVDVAHKSQCCSSLIFH